jgi:hypothetical protein
MPKIRNIIIFVAIAAVFVLAYIFFLKPKGGEEPSLVTEPNPSASPSGTIPVSGTSTQNGASLAAGEFLTLLLNVKNIRLEDAIFSDPAFQNLRDSSITLEPDGNEGRPNPFAPIGEDITLSAPIPNTGAGPSGIQPPAPNPNPEGNAGDTEQPPAGTL